MKIVLAGPTLTSSLTDTMPVTLKGAPTGTVATPVAPLAKALRDEGHDVHIVTLDPMIDKTVSFSDDGFSITYCPFRGGPRYQARHRSLDLFEKEIRHLTSAIQEVGPDIVHAHWTYEFAEAAVRSRRPHLVTMHDLGWDCFWQTRDAYRFMRLIMKYRIVPRVRHLSVVAPFMASKAKQYGYFGDVAVIPNGIDIPDFDPQRPARIFSEPPKFVTIGNRGRLKNVAAAIDAFAILQARYANAELHLFGPGLNPEFVASSAKNVFGHGNVNHGDLMTFLRDEATVLIHPSRIETGPVIAIEAKARGVPVVGGERSGGVPFVCGIDAGAILVDIENPPKIAEAAASIIASELAYHIYSEHSYEDAKDRFDIRLICRKYLSAYRSVLSGSWPPRQGPW